jgi:hypothetical protein
VVLIRGLRSDASPFTSTLNTKYGFPKNWWQLKGLAANQPWIFSQFPKYSGLENQETGLSGEFVAIAG